jgi:hypothetical protein
MDDERMGRKLEEHKPQGEKKNTYTGVDAWL